jgi:hypothetical protein
VTTDHSTLAVAHSKTKKRKTELTIEFTAWPKTSRFFRDIVITEKIDGTNAAVGIQPVQSEGNHDEFGLAYPVVGGQTYQVFAQSRNKLIKPGQDNAGFAGWVTAHAEELVTFLGEGLHFGEWWGSGIQRGYGLKKGEKHFSLFNTHSFREIEAVSDGLVRCVPVLYIGPMMEKYIKAELEHLQDEGSVAAPGFQNPEGICIYHTSSGIVQKVTLDNNDAGKWEHL